MKNTNTQGINQNTEKKSCNLVFADDIRILEKEKEHLQPLLDEISTKIKHIWLKVNTKRKTNHGNFRLNISDEM